MTEDISMKEYFDSKDKNGKNFQETERGVFLTIPYDHLNQAMQIVFEEGYLTSEDVFCDAGSGDGRVSIFSAVNGIESYGIEHELEMYELCLKNTDIFLKMFNDNDPKFILGDFEADQTYESAGFEFKQITAFFNYENNYNQIAQKIAWNSKMKTKFFLFTFNDIQPAYQGLEVIDIIETEADYVLKDMYDDVSRQMLGIPEVTYGKLIVYQKNGI